MKRKFLIMFCLILFIVSIADVSATEDLNQTIKDDASDILSVSQIEDNMQMNSVTLNGIANFIVLEDVIYI